MPVSSREVPLIPADNRILYYRRDRGSFRFLSHFYPSPLVLDGSVWPTVEHYYQFQKSFDPNYRAAIRAAEHPGHVKHLAASPTVPRRFSKGSWFRKHGTAPRPDWDEVKLDIMRRADGAKYMQNVDLAALLMATGTAELVEDSASEPFWGIGQEGLGHNWAGRILMEVRAGFRSSNERDGAKSCSEEEISR